MLEVALVLLLLLLGIARASSTWAARRRRPSTRALALSLALLVEGTNGRCGGWNPASCPPRPALAPISTSTPSASPTTPLPTALPTPSPTTGLCLWATFATPCERDLLGVCYAGEDTCIAANGSIYTRGLCDIMSTLLPIPTLTSTRYPMPTPAVSVVLTTALPTPEPTLTFAPTTAVCSWASIPNKLLCHNEGAECYAPKASERSSDGGFCVQNVASACCV